MPTIPYEKFDNTWTAISIEMELDLVVIERSRYTFLDLLSDVGGLSGMVASIFAVFMTFWNYQSYDYFLVS